MGCKYEIVYCENDTRHRANTVQTNSWLEFIWVMLKNRKNIIYYKVYGD